MGLSSWIKGTLNHIKKAVSHGISAVKHATPKVFKAVVNATKSAGKLAGKAVTTVYSDVKSGLRTIEQDSLSVVRGAQGTLSSIGSSLATPLALAAGAVGVAFVLTRT